MMNPNQTAKEEKEFRNKSIDFQKRQVELGEKQQEILEKQTEFSRILTLATGVLAFSGLIQIIVLFLKFNLDLREGNLVYLDYFLYGLLIFLGGVLLVYIYALLKPKCKNPSA
ncbi:hypothetical protein HY449_00695 [Candidatus Pacearchaeota archaeon]|nr:hypothetical protein [Candidatus Pacearchaeota archaeon]